MAKNSVPCGLRSFRLSMQRSVMSAEPLFRVTSVGLTALMTERMFIEILGLRVGGGIQLTLFCSL